MTQEEMIKKLGSNDVLTVFEDFSEEELNALVQAPLEQGARLDFKNARIGKATRLARVKVDDEDTFETSEYDAVFVSGIRLSLKQLIRSHESFKKLYGLDRKQALEELRKFGVYEVSSYFETAHPRFGRVMKLITNPIGPSKEDGEDGKDGSDA